MGEQKKMIALVIAFAVSANAAPKYWGKVTNLDYYGKGKADHHLQKKPLGGVQLEICGLEDQLANQDRIDHQKESMISDSAMLAARAGHIAYIKGGMDFPMEPK